jgi:hypothetical protein
MSGVDAAKAFAAGAVEKTKAAFGPMAESSYTLPIIAGVIAVILIAIIVMVYFQIKQTSPVVQLKGPVDLYAPASPLLVDRPTATANMKGTYTLAFYVKIDSVPDMRAESTNLMAWPGVWSLSYNAAQEQLIWQFQQTPDGSLEFGPEPVVLSGVPLQRWTQVSIGFSGRTADLYVDGQLISTQTLSNLPPSANSSVMLTSTGLMMGQIASVQLWPRRLKINEVADNYTETSDSQGRPFLGPGFFSALGNIGSIPNLFCPDGNCGGSAPTATQAQTWDFPYA